MEKEESEEQHLPSEQESLPRNQNTDEGDEIISPEFLQSMPPEVQQTIKMSLGMFSDRLPSPVAKKITSEHVTKIIEISSEDDKRKFRYALYSKWFYLGYTIIGVAVFIFLIIYLGTANPQLLMEILKVFIGFIGGFGAGYAIKSYRGKD